VSRAHLPLLCICELPSDVVLEKHWKSVIHRSLCDYFFDAQKRVSNPEDVPPIISTPHHYLINIYHNNLYFVAVTVAEGVCGARTARTNTCVQCRR
jgi:AP-3 complex subunit mu